MSNTNLNPLVKQIVDEHKSKRTPKKDLLDSKYVIEHPEEYDETYVQRAMIFLYAYEKGFMEAYNEIKNGKQ